MSYQKEEIKEGITLHTISTNRFKTNLVAVFLTMPITRETVTKNTLIDLILKRGSANVPTQEELSKALENLYGASFDSGIDKTGDNHIMKFYIESIHDKYIDDAENILKESTDMLLDIIFHPLIENGQFKEEYFTSEKEKLRQIIESKIDDKATYSIYRCVEEMYKGEPFRIVFLWICRRPRIHGCKNLISILSRANSHL